MPVETLKFTGKSTRGDCCEGGKTTVDVGVVAGVTPDDGVVVVVPLADGSCEVKVCEVV